MNDEEFLSLNSLRLKTEDKVLALNLSCTIAKRLYKSLDDSIKCLLIKCSELGGRLAIITQQDGIILIIECPTLDITYDLSEQVGKIKTNFKEITGSLKSLVLFYKGSEQYVCFVSPGKHNTGEWQFFRDGTKK